jgi:IclR family transcriptional regulator, acetate operon repressor
MQNVLADNAAARSGVVRALSVVDLLASRAPEMLGVSTVARELALPKAVAHRILKQLVAVGFLTFDEPTKLYRLGAGALTVGLAALRSLDVPRIARPHLERLVQDTGETATLSVRQGWSRVYVDQVLSPHEVRMSVSLGTVHALHAGASSKVILAAMPSADVEQYLADHGLPRVTESTITDIEALRKELSSVRRRGYGVSLGERQADAGSVAAAVHDASGSAFGSLSVCGPKERFTPSIVESYAGSVVREAMAVSAQLGYRREAPAG